MIQSKTLVATIAVSATALALISCSKNEVEPAADARSVELAKTAPDISFKPGGDDYTGTASKPGSPYSISYRIIGTPIVGSPVVVDLKVASSLGPRPVNLDYRINDASSMVLAESQPARVKTAFADNDKSLQQQVTVIPQREGRFYLNVSVSFEDETGTTSTVTAVPIQVGTGTRELQVHGRVETDENGESVRVLSDD
ncbi:MAG TPA: hypothetical protein PKH39_04215 [Woeseiaceae bacterium]|nr:hypothetical protein [Woeseiaceae bacterium]